MFYQPKKNPFSIDPYKSLIFPRPIGWISSIDKKGIVNLAPYSYFNAIADDPPQIMFVAGASDSSSQKKDTLTNIMTTKEFVVNFATTATREQMNLSSNLRLPRQISYYGDLIGLIHSTSNLCLMTYIY